MCEKCGSNTNVTTVVVVDAKGNERLQQVCESCYFVAIANSKQM